MVEAVREQLSQLCPEIILFLSKLKRLYVCSYDPEVADRVSSFLISSVTKHKEVSSCVVQLLKKNLDDTEESCDYYLWEKTFPVKPENRFGVRMDVQRWVITIAFPSGERMRTATSSVGIFAFLPTTMVTDFPFLIQADFILNSLRDSILLDNVWNLGILECIPSAFVNAFQSHSLRYPVGKRFEFLPAQAPSIPKFKDLRESIRAELQSLVIVPCEIIEGMSSSVRPQEAVRVLPNFRDLVGGFKIEGYVLSSSSKYLLRRVLHPSVDLEKYNAVLEFLGVEFANDHWYTECIQRLCSSIDEKVTGSGIISLLKCIKNLTSSSPDDPLLRDLTNSIARRKCLKTLDWTDAYKTPEESILFDPAWESILDRTKIPTIDENFYGTDILVYKNQLRDIGVKVDPLHVCSLLSGILSKLAKADVYFEETFIEMIYTFLNKFQWRPEVPDGTTPVWVPDQGWFAPQHCVLHDKQNLFLSFLCVLDEHYNEELLPVFSSAFGVAENPSFDHYVDLWNKWNGKGQVTLEEYCCSFWKYVVDNWNPEVEEALKGLTKLPATKSMSEKVYQINRKEVFLADDLQLKNVFLRYDEAPLFVWFPRNNCLCTRRLYEIYESLGVKKVSESVQYIPFAKIQLDPEKDVLNGLINRGLIKIILGFLAGSQVTMPLEDRKDTASSIARLKVYKLDNPYEYIYRLMRSESTKADVKKVKLVSWKKRSERLFIDNSGYNNGKSDLKFVAAFADELAQGLLVQAKARATLSKIIQIGFLSGFSENEVDVLLMGENLELSVEDKEFLDAAFPSSTVPGPVCGKRSSMERDQSDPSSTTSGKKPR
ncbi:hypothetical protein ABKV19_008283 [Rosa sericea]